MRPRSRPGGESWRLSLPTGRFSARATVEGMPEPLVVEQGEYLTIFKKQPDGTWLIAIDIWNSDLPLPEQGAES